MILSKGNQIILGKEITKSESFSFDDSELGERFSKVEKVVPEFLKMLDKYKTPHLYRILKIQL